jgi:uncharacterized protein YggE
MKTLLATLAVLVFTGLASANMTVTGTGKVTYVPDIVTINAEVNSEASTATEAWQKNAALVKKLFQFLEQHHMGPKDIRTTGLNLSPRYTHPKDEEPVLVGYTASYTLTVTVHKLDQLGSILDGLVENGANRGMGISFGCSNPEKLQDEARHQAVTEARRKAEQMVKAAGGSLGAIVSISEGQFAPPQYYRLEAAKAPVDAGLIIAAGQQELSVSVTVVYTINNNLVSEKS